MEREVSNILLDRADPADCFRLKWGWFTFGFKIKPISTKDNIRIGAELCKIREFEDENVSYFQALMGHANDAKFINRAIAIATRTHFVGIVAHIVSNLSNEKQNILFKIVIKNSDAEVFFYTMALAKKMNILKKKPE